MLLLSLHYFSLSYPAYLLWLEKELKIRSKDDWYSVTVSAVRERGGSGFLDKFDGSLQRALVTAFPEYSWKSWLFERYK